MRPPVFRKTLDLFVDMSVVLYIIISKDNVNYTNLLLLIFVLCQLRL
jgi:hypothetical protein